MIKIVLLMAVLLSACTPVEIKKANTIPPLSSVVPLIKPSMGLPEVNKALSGHTPYLQYTYHDYPIWEVIERTDNLNNNSVNANKLTIIFDSQGKVQESSSSFCFLPDVEPMLGNAPTTSCYQKQLFPFDKQQTYDAIKRLLIISNYQVDHSDAASEIISATGVHSLKENANKTMFIKLSIIFSTKEKFTEVVMSATFSMSEKQSTWVQAGFAGVTLPVPLPFQKTEEWIDSGIVTPKFYLEFYDALSKLIAREYLPYKPVTANLTISPKPAVISLPAPTTVEPYQQPNAPQYNRSTANVINEELSNLDGPIDGVQKPKKKSASVENPTDTQTPEENHQNADIFSELNGKPIDSKK